jgi:hypothetical protein
VTVSRYSFVGAAIGLLVSLASVQVAAQSVRFPQDKLRRYAACTKIASSKVEHEAASENEADVLEFSFTDTAYFWGEGFTGPAESDADWVRSPSHWDGNAWKLSRSSGELTIIDKITSANTTYACREVSACYACGQHNAWESKF